MRPTTFARLARRWQRLIDDTIDAHGLCTGRRLNRACRLAALAADVEPRLKAITAPTPRPK